jgi:CMP-2-keto-3-deoxyoctulosonic acid synthetase
MAVAAALRDPRFVPVRSEEVDSLSIEVSVLTPLERVERLEQLRFLESGRRIIMAQAVEFIPAGVDTLEDLRRVQGLLAPDTSD